MANGERWQEYFVLNNTIACPKELEFGTTLVIYGNEYTCRDRGGAIVVEEGVYWVDVLGREPLAPYGTIVEAYLKEN